MIKKINILLIALSIVLGYTVSAHAIAVTYTTIDEMLIYSDVEGPHTFDISNQTGVLWTDFHFRLMSAGGHGVLGGSYTGPGTASYSVPFTDPNYFNTLDVIGLSIPAGDVYHLSFLTGANPGYLPGVDIYGTPTFDTTPPPPSQVPEPSTMLLLGSGLVGLGLMRRKLKV